MYEFVDCHCHILPVDHGCPSLDNALLMLLNAYDQGVRRLILTPHSSAFDGTDHVLTCFQQLRTQVSQYFPELHLELGCELLLEPEQMDTLLWDLKNDKYPIINNTLLVEFCRWVMPEKILPALDALIQAGYRVVLAHPEEYIYTIGNLALIQKARRAGVLLQITVSNLIASEERIRSWTQTLVGTGVDFLGSDAHIRYPGNIQEALNWLYGNTGKEKADRIAGRNGVSVFTPQKGDDIHD